MMNEYIDAMDGGLRINKLIKLHGDSFFDPYPVTDTNVTNMIDQNSRRKDLELFLDYFTSEKQDFACSNKITEYPISASAEVPPAAPKQHLPRFREYQDTQWEEQHRGLLQYIQKYGHCCVPNKLDENPRLGRWVKRQRYQYKLLQQGKKSTLTASRVQTLQEVGFIWDSHAALWVERFNELKDFLKAHGHCNVPSTYPKNPQLSTWVKCQRRQYKLYSENKASNLTTERISELEKLGFVFDGRLVRSNTRQWKK